MITIHKKQTVKIEWDVYKLHSSEREDFNGALLKVFLNCNADRYNVDYTLSGNTIMVDIPHDLPIATYTLEALWGRSDSLSDIMSWHRCYCPEEFESFHSVNRSVKSDLFAITDVESEASYPDNNTVTIKVRTSVRSFGYDGMSAYEIAVMRGEWDESEVAWIHKIMDVEKPFYIGDYTGGFVVRCKPSDMQAAYEAKRMFYVGGTAIPGIPSQSVGASGNMDIIPVQVGTNNNTYIIEFFRGYTSLVRIVLTYDKALDKFLDAKVYQVIMHSAETTKQETGESEVMVMSQKAVTEALVASEARGTKNIESLRSEIDQNLSDLERIVTDNKNELDKDVQTIGVTVSHHNDDISHLQGDVRNNTNNITALGSRIDALGSVYNIQGTKASLAQLLAITSAKKGDVYSIDSEFYLAGKFYPASTNVVCVTAFTSASDNKASCWDPLGGTFNASLYLEKSKAAVVNPSDLTESLERIEDITYTEKGKEFVSGSAVGSVLPFKLISKTTLDNGYTAWYRLALNYPTGSSNGAHQLLLQYAETTTIPTEADWKTINYINNISLSSLLRRSDVANNLTTTASGKVLDARQGKTLADAIANKQDTLVSGKNISTINSKDLLSGEDIIIETPSSSADIAGLLNIKDAAAVAEAQNLLTEDGQTATYIITDHDGNYPSPNVPLVYLDDMAQLRDLLYRGNDKALAYLLDTKEAYYNISGKWYSQRITNYVKVPTFHLQTAKVGDLVTIIRHEFTADEFYNKYIDFASITIEDTAFQLYKLSSGYRGSDGEFIQYLIRSGAIHSCPNNPEEDSSVAPVPLAVNEKVVLYTAQITPNVNTVFSGEFWSGNINAPGIYCYVTSGRPAGVPSGENFIGVVSPDGTKMLYSMKNPNNIFILESGNWRRIGVGKNTGGTGEVFNDYAENFAHSDHAHAEGQKCRAESYNAHAEGYSTKAGWNAHSEGSQTEATGQNSHAEGDSTKATTYNAHAEGYRTNARGNGSHAEGNSDGFDTHNEAIGMGSHVEGGGTQAVSNYAHAEGTCNVGVVDAIHEVGIGTNDVRKNAHTIMKDGKHYIYGVGGYDGTNINAAKDVANVINKNVHLSFFTMNEFTEEEGYEYPAMDRNLHRRQVLYIESDQPLTGKLCFAKYQRRKIQWNNRKGWIKDKNRVRRIEGENTSPHTLFGFSYVVTFSYELDRRENDRYIYKINMSVKLQDGTVKNYSAISIDHLVYIELPSDDPLTVQGTMGDSTLMVKTTSGNNRSIADYTIEGTDDDKPNRGTTLKYGFFLTSEDYSNDTEIFPVTIGIDSTIQQNKILAKNWRRWVFLKK